MGLLESRRVEDNDEGTLTVIESEFVRFNSVASKIGVGEVQHCANRCPSDAATAIDQRNKINHDKHSNS